MLSVVTRNAREQRKLAKQRKLANSSANSAAPVKVFPRIKWENKKLKSLKSYHLYVKTETCILNFESALFSKAKAVHRVADDK